MRKARLVRFGLVSSVVAMSILGAAVGAGASITVGQLPPPGAELKNCNSPGYDEAQKSVAAGASYTVPTAGVLTSWSTNSPIGGSLGLKVFRPVGGEFLVAAEDGPRVLATGAVSTFPVSIPVQPGDLVGIDVPPVALSNCSFKTEQAGDVLFYNEGNAALGSKISFSSEPGHRLNITANLLPPPTASSIGPGSGSIAGGNSVTISGTNFASLSSVTFGGVAASYTVNSEDQITAIAPPAKAPGSVSVAVTTVAGVGVSAQAYSYVACTVPKLKAKSLKAAKKAIKKAGCKVGKLTKRNGATAKTGKVSKQNPKPGTVVVTGTAVKVTLKPPS